MGHGGDSCYQLKHYGQKTPETSTTLEINYTLIKNKAKHYGQAKKIKKTTEVTCVRAHSICCFFHQAYVNFFCCCRNKLPQTSQLKTTQTYHLTASIHSAAFPRLCLQKSLSQFQGQPPRAPRRQLSPRQCHTALEGVLPGPPRPLCGL